MIVLNDLFDYGLKIYQNTDYFKFSIDSILLAEFAKIKPGSKVLDMCTGNVPIPLILSTIYDNITIDAVEIQAPVYDLANKSIEENNLENKISLFNEDIKTFNPKKQYDVIICNPPYFKISDTSQKNTNDIKRIARHEEKLNLTDAIENARRLLNSNGTFYMVQRTERFLETCRLLEKFNFGIRDTVFVYTKENTNAEFFLIEASLSKKSDIKVKSINIENLKTYKNIFRKG